MFYFRHYIVSASRVPNFKPIEVNLICSVDFRCRVWCSVLQLQKSNHCYKKGKGRKRKGREGKKGRERTEPKRNERKRKTREVKRLLKPTSLKLWKRKWVQDDKRECTNRLAVVINFSLARRQIGAERSIQNVSAEVKGKMWLKWDWKSGNW